MVDKLSQSFELFNVHQTSLSGKTSFNDLHRDCLQNVVDYLSLIEGFTFLSHISKKYRAFRPSVTLSAFIDTERKNFLKRVLNAEIIRYSISDFGFIDNVKPNCTNVSILANYFRNLSPHFGADDLSDIIVSPIASNSKYHLTPLKGVVSRKNIRALTLISLTQKTLGVWVILHAFQCQNSRLNCVGYICRNKRPCKFSYSIQKCSSRECHQPFFACLGCRIRCYDCNQAGLCTSCLFETPNSGEIVYACAPCRGF